jgi:pSer/pThr/pTyr-binding forkhead associated (FHA) protein
MPEIVVKFEDRVIERVVTERTRITVGRTPDNNVVLDNRGVSRRHATIEFRDDKPFLIDNDSLNGTFLNSRKIVEEPVRDGDVVTIGKFTLIYHEQAEDAPGGSEELDSTMILDTRKHRELMERDDSAREVVARLGGSCLIAEADSDVREVRLDRPVTTFGKGDAAHVKVKGFMVSGLQAKIAAERSEHILVNLGRKGKTLVNGVVVSDRVVLRNDDRVTVGKTVFRYLRG